MMRNLTPGVVALTGASSRNTPKPKMTASARAAKIVGSQRRWGSLSVHRVAGAANIATAASVSPCRPTIEAICASTMSCPSAMPISFQGKPVNATHRNHSLAPRPTASAKTREAPGNHSKRASAKPSAGNNASAAGNPRTPRGKAHANLSASTRKAEPSHHRPAVKYPKPHHQPAPNAALSDAQRVASRGPRSTDPSISQTAIANGAMRTGANEKGGIARAPAAPPKNAIDRRGQPQARMTF